MFCQEFILKHFQHTKQPRGHIGKAEAKMFFNLSCVIMFLWEQFHWQLSLTLSWNFRGISNLFYVSECWNTTRQGLWRNLHTHSYKSLMFAVAAILYGLLPLIILIFIVNCSCDKLRCCKGVRSLLTCKGHVSKQSAASSWLFDCFLNMSISFIHDARYYWVIDCKDRLARKLHVLVYKSFLYILYCSQLTIKHQGLVTSLSVAVSVLKTTKIDSLWTT